MRAGGCSEHGDYCPRNMKNWLVWMARGGGAVVYVVMRPGECVMGAKARDSTEGVK